MRKLFIAWFCVFVFCVAPACPQAQVLRFIAIPGRVVYVKDGDTFDFLPDSLEVQQIVKQLWGRDVLPAKLDCVDAPDLMQPFGKEAKGRFHKLVDGKDAVLIMADVNEELQAVGFVYVGKENVNRMLIAEGVVRVTDGACSRAYQRYVDKAKKLRRGIWGLKDKEQGVSKCTKCRTEE